MIAKGNWQREVLEKFMSKTDIKHKAQDAILEMAQTFAYRIQDAYMHGHYSDEEKQAIIDEGLKQLDRIYKLFGYKEVR